MTKIKPLAEVLQDREDCGHTCISDRLEVEAYLNRHYPIAIFPFPPVKVEPEPEPIDEGIDWLAMMIEPEHDPLMDFPPDWEDEDWEWMEPGDTHYYPHG